MSHGLPVIVAQGDGTQDLRLSRDKESNGWAIAHDMIGFRSSQSQSSVSVKCMTLLRRWGRVFGWWILFFSRNDDQPALSALTDAEVFVTAPELCKALSGDK